MPIIAKGAKSKSAMKTPSRPRAGAVPPIPKADLLKAAGKDLLDIAGVSALTKVKKETVSVYRGRDLPEPDLTFGRSPVWHRETIIEWDKTRRKVEREGN